MMRGLRIPFRHRFPGIKLKNLAILLVLSTGLISAPGCSFIKKTVRFREDIRTVTFRVPAVSDVECRRQLLRVLNATGWVKEASTDESEATVTISYNSRELAEKNLLYAISRAGFDVDDVAGDPDAKEKLPETCR